MTTDSELIQTFDSLLRATYAADEPGAAVIVVRAGAVLYRAGRGLANLELGVPIEPDMVFRIGSMTKQFTAVAILMLAAEGRLALADPLTKFLPDYPAQGHTITVEHLLTHTSGIKSYPSMPEWQALWRKDFTLPELIDLFKDQPMDFAPGERFAYNNSGYILLGAIIEQVAGLTYEQFIPTRIFDPLGMTHSYYDSPLRLIPRRVAGYDKGPDGYTHAAYLSMTQPYAAGALASSVDDLALWDAALYTDRLLKPDMLQQAFVAFHLNDGSATDYGFGWMTQKFAGHEAYGHGGGIHGFISLGLRLPEDQVYVAALSNNPGSDLGGLFFKIAGWAIGQPFVEPTPIELGADVLAEYAGEYRSPMVGEWRLTLDGQRLMAQPGGAPPMELVPFSPSDFFIKGHTLDQVSFKRDAAAVVTGFEFHGAIGSPALVVKV